MIGSQTIQCIKKVIAPSGKFANGIIGHVNATLKNLPEHPNAVTLSL
jgi:hypothetical protein